MGRASFGKIEVVVDDVAEGWWRKRKRRQRKMTVVDSISDGVAG